jgi:hypothetical protein
MRTVLGCGSTGFGLRMNFTMHAVATLAEC